MTEKKEPAMVEVGIICDCTTGCKRCGRTPSMIYGVAPTTQLIDVNASMEENKRLREALEYIAQGMTINPQNPVAETAVAYFVGFAKAALKKDKPT